MSFTRLLAAGRSIMGIRKAPSPYRMSQQHLLPKFTAASRLETAAGPKEASESGEAAAVPDSVAPRAIADAESAAVVAKAPAAGPGTAEPVGGEEHSEAGRAVTGRATKPTKRLTALAAGLANWTKPARKGTAAGKSSRHVQGELSLDRVRVVRNDLRDSDYEVVRARNVASQRPQSPRAGLGMVWNRLSARLLRQAALEFNLVQKERGKLLSQAGHGDGGARGA
jgi:hypothetical protein